MVCGKAKVIHLEEGLVRRKRGKEDGCGMESEERLG